MGWFVWDMFAPGGRYQFQSAGGVVPARLDGRYRLRPHHYCVTMHGGHSEHEGCFRLVVTGASTLDKIALATGRVQAVTFVPKSPGFSSIP